MEFVLNITDQISLGIIEYFQAFRVTETKFSFEVHNKVCFIYLGDNSTHIFTTGSHKFQFFIQCYSDLAATILIPTFEFEIKRRLWLLQTSAYFGIIHQTFYLTAKI